MHVGVDRRTRSHAQRQITATVAIIIDTAIIAVVAIVVVTKRSPTVITITAATAVVTVLIKFAYLVRSHDEP